MSSGKRQGPHGAKQHKPQGAWLEKVHGSEFLAAKVGEGTADRGKHHLQRPPPIERWKGGLNDERKQSPERDQPQRRQRCEGSGLAVGDEASGSKRRLDANANTTCEQSKRQDAARRAE